MNRFVILPIFMVVLLLGCSSKNLCKESQVEAQLKEFVGVNLWKESNPVEYSVINLKGKFSNQEEVIKQKAWPYINALKLQEAKQVEKDREYYICNGLMTYDSNKLLLKYSVEEFDLGKVRQYKVKVLNIDKLPK